MMAYVVDGRQTGEGHGQLANGQLGCLSLLEETVEPVVQRLPGPETGWQLMVGQTGQLGRHLRLPGSRWPPGHRSREKLAQLTLPASSAPGC